MEPATGIHEFLRFVVRGVLREPDTAVITRTEEEDKTVFTIKVPEDDVSRIMGKENRGLFAMRHLAAAAGARHGLKVYVRMDGPPRSHGGHGPGHGGPRRGGGGGNRRRGGGGGSFRPRTSS
ncbi:MAG: KH domain-containing protein [Verrucomicrobiales bacterium]|nr:KH domain-containing protein [Verrucomicrobiales bacterium]